jgi:REP element-mobilizing transposase RayT
MPHSYSCNWQHIVFSTKERRRLIRSELQSNLWPYIASVAKNHGMHPFAIGGIEDHVHILLTIPATKDIAKAVQEIKSNSSRWMREHVKLFQWQEGYGSFSVSKSSVSAVAKYIGRQGEHHRKITFEEEFIALLEKHGVEYDPKYVLRLIRVAPTALRFSEHAYPALPCWAKLFRAYGAEIRSARVNSCPDWRCAVTKLRDPA